MKIYVIRHAQTEANVNSIIQGQANTEITLEGIANAKLMAQYFFNKHITKIFSSPIKRAYETANLIADACSISMKNINFDDRLMEIDLSPWEHKKIDDLDSSDSLSSYKTYKSKPIAFRPISGENLFDVRKRAIEAFDLIVKNCHDDDNVVIVSHSVTIRTLLTHLENKSIDFVWSYNIPPVSVTEINYNQGIVNLIKIGEIVY